MAKRKDKKNSKSNKKKSTSKKSISKSSNWLTSQKERKPILLFGLGLAALMIFYFWMSYTSFFEDYINLPIVKGYAHISSFLLNILGQGTTVDNTFVTNPFFRMNIGRGCDAVSPTILFMGAVALFPAAFAHKWKTLAIAPFAFALLNIVRIVSLFLLGVYVPSLFDFAHIEFWQGVFILITILAWFYWLLQVLRKTKSDGSV